MGVGEAAGEGRTLATAESRLRLGVRVGTCAHNNDHRGEQHGEEEVKTRHRW